MRKRLHSVYKAYMHDTLVKTRDSMELNQEQMAQLLDMSCRAYAALEANSSACGLMTLVLFVLNCCPNRSAFFDDLFNAFEKALKADGSAAWQKLLR